MISTIINSTSDDSQKPDKGYMHDHFARVNNPIRKVRETVKLTPTTTSL